MVSRLKVVSLAGAIILLKLLAMTRGQTSIGEKYYRAFSIQRVNWYRAYQFCNLFGMQLASIETESDRTALRQYLFDNTLLSNNYWLGGNNLADRGEYVWLSSGQKFSYTKWAPSQPVNAANRCVHTNANFEWVSDTCTNAHYFICSQPLEGTCGPYGGCAPNYILEY